LEDHRAADHEEQETGGKTEERERERAGVQRALARREALSQDAVRVLAGDV